MADMVLGERVETAEGDDAINLSGVSAALSVLAGIAASDAATCLRLGQRSRGQDHREALTLLRRIEPDGDGLAKDLDRLLGLKDNAHYGVLGVADSEARKALEWAGRLTETVRRLSR